jgi:hypothetical protein
MAWYSAALKRFFETLLCVYLYSCLLASRIPDHGHSLDLLDRDLGVPFPVSVWGLQMQRRCPSPSKSKTE